jgi:hypothetical protein
MIEHGLLDDPKHKEKMPWPTFIKARVQSMAACDFFIVEAWTPKRAVASASSSCPSRVRI